MRNIIIPLLLLSAPALADAPSTLTVTSKSFEANSMIPTVFTCDGAETSPPLAWSNVPASAKSIAILVEDPDAPKGTVTHWIVTNLPPTTTELGAGAVLPDKAVAMKNEKGKLGYMGPCPPSGTHHYHFRVFALDRGMVAMGGSRSAFLSKIKGHVLAEGELVGLYEKQH
jgi:Raf kinase inhibitor-like YbhB/YbcL family protein